MSEIDEKLEKEIDKEIQDYQKNKPEMSVVGDMDEMLKNNAFGKKFKTYAENYLQSCNKYKKAKAIADDLKVESDAAGAAMINYAKELGVLTTEINLQYDGMATFKIKESYFGNVLKENRAKVFTFFKQQRREKEFFELKERQSNFNAYVKEKLEECKRNKKGGEDLIKEVELNLPEGLTLGRKHKITLSNRNDDFGMKK
jgi:hypothetical protein